MMRPLVLFYILVFYVLLQFSWWAYLLIHLNDEVYAYKIELLEAKHSNPEELSAAKKIYDKKLHQRWSMVLGEGGVFLSLLLFGIYRTNLAFKREVELSRQQKNFLLSVTHEFKSPLAAVKLNLQTLQKHHLDEPRQKEVLSKAIIETDRINTLVENVLLATRIDGHSDQLMLEDLHFSDFLHKTVSDHIDRMERNHNIVHQITPGIHIKGDSLALSSLLINLLENAEKYSTADALIEVGLTRNNQSAILIVRDQGIGIPDNEKTKIFDKFYRVGNEETRRTKGTGLGLYIVKHIVNMHKGKIEVRNNHPAGTVFEIRFPVA
jgi:signal transduction histidine kinase